VVRDLRASGCPAAKVMREPPREREPAFSCPAASACAPDLPDPAAEYQATEREPGKCVVSNATALDRLRFANDLLGGVHDLEGEQRLAQDYRCVASQELNVLCGWLPRCKFDLMFGVGRVQSCVWPVDAVTDARPDGIRELGSILLCWLDATDIRRI
jgi:hypothetical protein